MALAVVIGVLAAAAVTFAPAHGNGASCGTWLDPTFSASDARTGADAYELGASLGAGDLAASGVAVTLAYRECSDALHTRRTWATVMLGLAVLLPAGIGFVAAGRKTAF